jgi:hypothetical protein
MKKKLLWLGVILMISGVGFAAFLPLFKKAKEIPVTKTVSFSLYKGSNYNSKAYKESSAQIDIIIEKVSTENRTKIWDTTVDAKLLSKYPLFKKAISKTVIIPGIYESREHLEISYILIYNSNGSILTMPGEKHILTNANVEIIL